MSDRLDYGTQLSPDPIALSIGRLKKPTLRDISRLTFERFNFFEYLLIIKPEEYYSKLKQNDEEWFNIPEETRDNMVMYDLICKDKDLMMLYLSMLNFFFIENVTFVDGYFIVFNGDEFDEDWLSTDEGRKNINGVISKESFDDVLNYIRQICCVERNTKEDQQPKFKNALAKKLYEKMQKSANKSDGDQDSTLPNIVSAVAARHPSINLFNIWDLTVFQLLDTFKRMQTNSFYDINAHRVSVWGDEKNTFDAALWYKNTFNKK